MSDAESIIGSPEPDKDWELTPGQHALLYQATAPGLAAVLGSPGLAAIAGSYVDKNKDAVDAQKSYKSAMGWANRLILAAAAAGAAMMAVQILWGTDTNPPGAGTNKVAALVTVLGFLSGALGSAAAGFLSWASGAGKLTEWMQQRAGAEAKRLAYFEAVVTPRANQPADIPLNLLRLYYFRRYLLLNQLHYFETQGTRHRRAADGTLMLAAAAATFASLAAFVAGGGSADPKMVAFGALGVFAAALSSFASNRETISQDRRNGERYRSSKEALRELEGRFSDIREEVEKGNAQAMLEYVKIVNDQLAADHRQWLAGMEASREVAAKLEEALAATRQKRQDAAATSAGRAVSSGAAVSSSVVVSSGGSAASGSGVASSSAHAGGASGSVASGSGGVVGGGVVTSSAGGSPPGSSLPGSSPPGSSPPGSSPTGSSSS
jgi:hypothetical protein